MHGIYAHARFDYLDLDLDARLQRVGGKGEKSALNYFDKLASNKLETCYNG